MENKKKLKLLYLSNERDCNYNKEPESTRCDILPRVISKKIDVLGVGKYDLWKFYRKYLEFKPDLIVSTWIPAGFVPVFFKKLGLIKCPIIHRWEDYYGESMTNYPRIIVDFMEKFTAKNADYIITVLKTLQLKSKEMGKEVFFLPYGITYGKKKTKINLDKLKTKKDNVKVIYLGDLSTPYKRVDKIIEAVKEINCDLFLFGHPVMPELKKLSRGNKNIHFMGWADAEEVESVLKQGDILVNTANHDICMKFLDYINAGKSILALNDRPSNFFKHRETAFLTNDFKKGLIELVKDKALRKKIEKNLKKIKLYTWEEVGDIHLKLYKNLLERKDLREFETSYYHV